MKLHSIHEHSWKETFSIIEDFPFESITRKFCFNLDIKVKCFAIEITKFDTILKIQYTELFFSKFSDGFYVCSNHWQQLNRKILEQYGNYV